MYVVELYGGGCMVSSKYFAENPTDEQLQDLLRSYACTSATVLQEVREVKANWKLTRSYQCST